MTAREAGGGAARARFAQEGNMPYRPSPGRGPRPWTCRGRGEYPPNPCTGRAQASPEASNCLGQARMIPAAHSRGTTRNGLNLRVRGGFSARTLVAAQVRAGLCAPTEVRR